MKILHLCLNGPYTDNWGYQENILPKYHRLAGNNVTVIVSNMKHLPSGEIVEVDGGISYTEDGVKVIRVAPKILISRKCTELLKPYPIYKILYREEPDFIMVHGLMGSISELSVKRYVRNCNPKCIVCADLHEYYLGNRGGNISIKLALIKSYYRSVNKLMYPLYKKVFCITPNCMDYAKDYYHVPKAKLELLPLGYDPQKIASTNRNSIRHVIREKYHIGDGNILIVHGGKIIPVRKTMELIDAAAMLDDPRIRLIIFGGADSECMLLLQERMQRYAKWIRYTGHLEQKDYYDLYLASDFAAFPGRQSTIWQEAIGCGLPLLIYRWDGVEYLDRGGNIAFIESQESAAIKRGLEGMLEDNKYIEMAEVAKQKAAPFFSYERIAQQVLDSSMK
ncbi:putative Glycosyl transferase group 1 [uncultured spirochete]|uniref:Putative Glycosyl transferase group 1 n=1 Tax=uncultured spirochete TaxID=156406 RepID=A0A3P3XR50_9SPIR|nr:putative Glycosyl transferase group 1 [uncultured spirochete]